MTLCARQLCRRLSWLLMALACWFCSAAAAFASPFCVVVQGLPDQCIYADGGSCQNRANQLGGVCAANVKEIRPGFGPGSFCLVSDNVATDCVFFDRTSCENDARKRHTACVQRTPSTGITAFDPFAIRRPY